MVDSTLNLSNSKSNAQKPAILVNQPGDELVDPLEKNCMRLEELTRCVSRYYLTPMQKELDLNEPKPTLAQRTRFNRLQRLNGILNEMIGIVRDVNNWRTIHTNLSGEIKKIIDRMIHQTSQTTSQLRTPWISVTVALDSKMHLQNNKEFERKLIEYHVGLEDLLESLIKMILRVQKSMKISLDDSNSESVLPVNPNRLSTLEMSFPVHLTGHEYVAKELRGKSNTK